LKKNSLFPSSKFRIAVLGVLVIITLILVYFIYFKKNISTSSGNTLVDTNKYTPDSVLFDPKINLNKSIDSILFTFGIKKEWITTEPQKKQNQKAEWFVKSVLIPKDLTSVEVNLDISTFLNSIGMSSNVSENIINKDITISINNPDTAKKLPAAIIQVNHSDKAIRETGVVSIIIDKINTFSSDDIDKLIITKNEFSFVFPRNLDDIDIQHKLRQHKKDIVINLTYAGLDNYEADFSSGMDDKTIRERIKSFTADYSGVNKVLLTSPLRDVSLNSARNKIIAELVKFNIRVISDSMIVNAYNSNEKDKLDLFFNTLIQKANLTKNVIAIYPADKNEFEDFYNRIMLFKKLGYKFLNLTEYFNYLDERKKNQQQNLDKQLQEEQNKKKQKDKIEIPNRNKGKKPVDQGEIPKNQNKKQTEKKKK